MLPHAFAVANNGARRFVGDFPGLIVGWGTEDTQIYGALPGMTATSYSYVTMTNEHSTNKRIKVVSSSYGSFGNPMSTTLTSYIPVRGYSNPIIECRFFQSNVSVSGSESYHPGIDSTSPSTSGTWYTLSSGGARSFEWLARVTYNVFPTGSGGSASVNADNVYFQIRVTQGDYDPEIRTSTTNEVNLNALISPNETP